MIKKLSIQLLIVLLCLTARAQTNVLFGYVGDYSTNIQPNVNVTLTLQSPNPRIMGAFVVRQDPVTHTTDQSGFFAFTNVLWGKYTMLASGKYGTSFIFNVGTNTIGQVPLTALITNVSTVFPFGWTNYIIVNTNLAANGTVTSVGADGVFATGTITTSGSFTPITSPTFNGQNISNIYLGSVMTNGITSGTTGQVLTLNSSGKLSWSTVTNSGGGGGGTNFIQVIYEGVGAPSLTPQSSSIPNIYINTTTGASYWWNTNSSTWN